MTRSPRRPWSHRAKAIRNILLLLYLLVLIWLRLGRPLPALWEYRLMERRFLIPPTDIVLELKEPREAGRHTYVGLGTAVAVVDIPPYRTEIYPLTGDPMLLLLYGSDVRRDGQGGEGFVALCPPGEAVSAKLSLHCWNGIDPEVMGERRGRIFFFFLPYPEDTSAALSYPLSPGDHDYTLEFFDADGELVTAVTNPGP